MWHMAFCAALAFAIIRAGWVEPVHMSADTYLRTVVPIGFLYAGTLWLGNAAYVYLSVSFIQASRPAQPASPGVSNHEAAERRAGSSGSVTAHQALDGFPSPPASPLLFRCSK